MGLFTRNKWKFVENGGGPELGLDSADIETFKKDPIASLARETCQNSIDAKREGCTESVFVQFKSFKMKTKDIPGIKELKEEILECKNANNGKNEKYYERFSSMYNLLEKNEIECLRISDFNTKGLEGVRDYDREKAFYYLTKGNGLTTKVIGNSGGSKGIGKFASFVASTIQTVFYSTLNENNEKGYMGISKLASRPIKNSKNCTLGFGYFCRSDEVNPILEELVLDSEFKREEYGTDVYIIGFRKEDTWKKDIITKILESFMCAIEFGTLQVSVDDIVVNKDTLKDIVMDENYVSTITEKKNILGQYLALNNLNAIEKVVEIEGYGNITLKLYEFDKLNESYASKKCVMIRSPFMKITDFPISSVIPCSVMCIIHDNLLNKTLREIENPQHTEWETKRIDDTDKRREVKRLIKRLKEEIKIFVNENLLNGKNKEVDFENAGEFLPDLNENDAMALTEAEVIEKKPKIISKNIAKAKNNFGNVESESSESLIPDIGKHDEKGTESPIPEGRNTGNQGPLHDNDKKGGIDPEGENDVLRAVELTGIRTRTILIDKDNGIYLVTFISNCNEENCELEFFYLDDINNKYKPEIEYCTINGALYDISNGRVMNFKLQSGIKYNFELKTNLKDLYACEVKVYANR